MTTRFRELPWQQTSDGSPRRVGVEIEMAGVTQAVMAEAVRKEFSGTITVVSPFIAQVDDTEYGTFKIELDARPLKEQSYRDQLKRLGIELDAEDSATLDRWLADAAGQLVPHEIVAPPLPLEVLPRMDRVRAALQSKGARGTESSLMYAFALQLNIEAHSLKADWLTSIIKAFVLLYEPLVKASNIDFSRRLSPYIDHFPGSYVRLVLQPGYEPDLEKLIDDYLEHNPTRNRPLDMLPLFTEIDCERVMAAPVERELIKPRPALHYRLPNSEIDDPAWTLARPFNGWAQVEQLAADRERLAAAATAYLQQPAQAVGQLIDEWATRIRDWF